MSVLHITPGPSVEVYRKRGEPRWCFNCRKRLAGTHVLLTDPPERQLSYYEPVWIYQCNRCKRDYRHFPGRE